MTLRNKKGPSKHKAKGKAQEVREEDSISTIRRGLSRLHRHAKIRHEDVVA
jgi:hypothetical protein